MDPHVGGYHSWRRGLRQCLPRTPLRALLVGLAAGLILTACSEAPGEEARADANNDGGGGTAIAAVELQPRDLSRELAVAAGVESRRVVRLASRASGTLDEVGPEIGDTVRAGDVVARLDMGEQRAELERAVAQQEEAELDYRRARELRDRQSISAAEYERARVALAVARSNRTLWDTRVGFGEVRAPRDGVVTRRYVEPGEAVESEATLFELTAMDELVVRPGVSEREIRHLEPGQEVPLRLDALPERTLNGTIARIFPAAEPGSRQVTVEVALPTDAGEAGVRPGYLARIRMPIDERPGVLAVPAEAVGEDGDQRYVYVVEDDALVRREVEPGVSRSGWTEIRSGLEAGDIVLATNPIDMREGERVRIVGWRG